MRALQLQYIAITNCQQYIIIYVIQCNNKIVVVRSTKKRNCICKLLVPYLKHSSIVSGEDHSVNYDSRYRNDLFHCRTCMVTLLDRTFEHVSHIKLAIISQLLLIVIIAKFRINKPEVVCTLLVSCDAKSSTW